MDDIDDTINTDDTFSPGWLVCRKSMPLPFGNEPATHRTGIGSRNHKPPKLGERMSYAPHYLLFVQAGVEEARSQRRGFWQFSIEPLHDEMRLEVKDYEDQRSLERLELLGLVRGLEALEQPSRVMLISTSTHLNRGLRRGLPVWRESNWEWERFGTMTPIRDRDLWQRIDHAMKFHQIQSRFLRVDDRAESIVPPPHYLNRPQATPIADSDSKDLQAEARNPSWIEKMRIAASQRNKSRKPLAIGA